LSCQKFINLSIKILCIIIRQNGFCQVDFFPAKTFLAGKIFLFQNTKKKFGGKKINLAKKGGPYNNQS
jgi:hypothetical protein